MKWIAGFLGFCHGGPLGALAGFALGWIFDKALSGGSEDAGAYVNREYEGAPNNEQQRYEGERNSFLFSLLVLSSYIIKADGRVMHSEMETVRAFLRQNFGEVAVQEGEQIMRRLFQQQDMMGAARYKSTISEACGQIARYLTYEQRLQLLNYLVVIAKADGRVSDEEAEALRFVSAGLGLSQADLDSMLSMGESADSLEAAYKVLGITSSATNDEVKAAYRAMALKHHPDRVATLGEDVRRSAEKKFQEINDAKDKIYKARGL